MNRLSSDPRIYRIHSGSGLGERLRSRAAIPAGAQMVSFFRRRCEAAWQRFAAFSGSTESIKIKTESLGTQVVEGILADGTRITRTLAAGQAGNQHPLDIISETWYSNELQTVVLSKTTDPRRGENICRLTEIQRGEPLHSFFEIPADYTVRDEPQAPSVDTATRK